MTYDLSSFKIGDRVQLHPATDRWMRGDRYGTVKSIGKKLLRVSMDVSGQTIRVTPENICEFAFTGRGGTY